MKNIHGFGLKDRLPIVIEIYFYRDRSFNVRVGSSFSDSHTQEMGVPQGTVLPITLFSLIINITQCFKMWC